MLKLYKKSEGLLYYWEAWDTSAKDGVIHWGVVGERGQKKKVRATSQSLYRALVQREIDEVRTAGFSEPSIAYILVIEYEVKTMSVARLKKLQRLGERLDQLMGWTGLGHFDGNGYGFEKMDVSVVVVDFEIAKKVIEADLEDTEFARYISIDCANTINNPETC